MATTYQSRCLLRRGVARKASARCDQSRYQPCMVVVSEPDPPFRFFEGLVPRLVWLYTNKAKTIAHESLCLSAIGYVNA